MPFKYFNWHIHSWLFSLALVSLVTEELSSSSFYSISPPVKVHGGRVPVERVRGVGVGEQLRQEGLEDVGQVVERRPGLVDHVQAHRAGHLVDVRVVHLEERNGTSGAEIQWGKKGRCLYLQFVIKYFLSLNWGKYWNENEKKVTGKIDWNTFGK